MAAKNAALSLAFLYGETLICSAIYAAGSGAATALVAVVDLYGGIGSVDAG